MTHRALLLAVLLGTLGAAQPPVLPAAVCSALKAERVKYGPTMTNAEAGTLMNAAVFRVRAQGFGLSGKKDGNNCPSLAGPIACDIVQHGLTMWDVLSDAGGGGTTGVNCGESIGEQTNPAGRPFVVPVDPGGTPDPPPSEVPALKARIAELEAALRQARAALQQAENALQQTQADMQAAREQRDAALAERDAALAALAAVTCQASVRPGWASALGIRASCQVVR